MKSTKDKEWNEYKPPSRDWLKKTQLSRTKLLKARRQISESIIYSMNLDPEDTFKSLKIVDGIIGQGEMLDNRLLGQVLHLRDFVLKRLKDKRRPMRAVRRWDRNMIEALPKKEQ